MSDQELLQFPCDFPLKIMGRHTEEFAPTILALVMRHCPDFNPEEMIVRPSSKGNYLGLTCTVHATSRAQLDELYRELSSHPLVKFAL